MTSPFGREDCIVAVTLAAGETGDKTRDARATSCVRRDIAACSLSFPRLISVLTLSRFRDLATARRCHRHLEQAPPTVYLRRNMGGRHAAAAAFHTTRPSIASGNVWLGFAVLSRCWQARTVVPQMMRRRAILHSPPAPISRRAIHRAGTMAEDVLQPAALRYRALHRTGATFHRLPPKAATYGGLPFGAFLRASIAGL